MHVISYLMEIRIDRVYKYQLLWDSEFQNQSSKSFKQLSYETSRAVSKVKLFEFLTTLSLKVGSAMSMTPYSDKFIEARINNVYQNVSVRGTSGVFLNITLMVSFIFCFNICNP